MAIVAASPAVKTGGAVVDYMTPPSTKRRRHTTLTNQENFAADITEGAIQSGIEDVVNYLTENPECIPVCHHMIKKGLLKPSARSQRKSELPAGNSRFGHISKSNVRLLLMGALDDQLDAIKLGELEDGDRDFARKYFQYLFKISWKTPLPSRSIEYLKDACKSRLNLAGARFDPAELPEGNGDDDSVQYPWVLSGVYASVLDPKKATCERKPNEITHVKHRFLNIMAAALVSYHRPSPRSDH